MNDYYALLETRTPMKTLTQLASETYEINTANGWDVLREEDWLGSLGEPPADPNKILAKLALVGTEIAEAVEAVRHNNFDNFEEEIADTIIRLLDITEGLGIDIQPVIEAKLAVNATRGYRHGGKLV
jgi:NTP pyrophosphatase (non-canonical NTP hydrolase)